MPDTAPPNAPPASSPALADSDTFDPAAKLSRYAAVVDDWDAFAAAVRAPRPTCLVVHRQRLDSARLAELCAAMETPEGRAVTPVSWCAGALRAAPGARPGLWWPHQAGLYQIQEEASLLPVHLLAPQAGEHILDLCAAPGGKTAQICMAVGDSGTVLANDRDSRRLTAIRDKMKRLGLTNLSTCVQNGAEWPAEAGGFDRVLVDAPCSAEGTNVRDGAAYLNSSSGFRARLARQQRALLGRALAAVRPGGRVVYATCSFAPEENEAVVSDVLATTGVRARITPVAIPGLDSAPGLAAWADRAFHPDLCHAHRLWPHRTGTGGFFAVVLTRDPADTPAVSPARFTAPDGEADMGDWLPVLRYHFDLPADSFADLRFLARGEEIQAVAAMHRLPPRPRIVSSGLPLAKRAGRWPKPTTAAALSLGAAARRNTVALDAAQRAAYLARQTVFPAPEQLAACDSKGYVIVTHAGFPLGAAMLRPGPPPRLDSEYPRIWVNPSTTRDAAADNLR